MDRLSLITICLLLVNCYGNEHSSDGKLNEEPNDIDQNARRSRKDTNIGISSSASAEDTSSSSDDDSSFVFSNDSMDSQKNERTTKRNKIRNTKRKEDRYTNRNKQRDTKRNKKLSNNNVLNFKMNDKPRNDDDIMLSNHKSDYQQTNNNDISIEDQINNKPKKNNIMLYHNINTNQIINHDVSVEDANTMDMYLSEVANGHTADLMGTNPHAYQPKMYSDLSRRFVPQYHYIEIQKQSNEKEESEIIPEKASPELVLNVAQRSVILNALEPNTEYDENKRQKILRSGDYWNGVWREDGVPKHLRSKKERALSTVRAKISPESRYYNLISLLKEISPRLIYVINKKNVR